MEYPKNYQELVRNFSTEEMCFDYIATVRWPDGFICPKCGGKKFWKSGKKEWICSACRGENKSFGGYAVSGYKAAPEPVVSNDLVVRRA